VIGAVLRRALLVLMATCAPLALAQTEGDPGAERGFKPELAYDFNGFDNVNLSNGNLMATIPLGRAYPVSETLSYSFALRYTGNLWNAYKKDEVSAPNPKSKWMYRPRGDDNAGLGWRISFGDLHQGATVDYNEATSAPYRYRYVTSDGGSHYFWDTLHEPVCAAGQSNTNNCDKIEPGFSYTRDGSYLRLRVVGTARIVEFPDGQRHRFVPGPAGLRLDSIYTAASTLDASGTPTSNYVKFDYSIANQWTIRDSHNREHRVVFSPHGEVQRVELAAFAFRTATYTLTTGQHTIKRVCLDATAQDQQLDSPVYFLKSLELPSGETWSFGYELPTTACSDTSATLTSATFPTKGRVEWTYRSLYSEESPTAVSVTERKLFDAAGGEAGRKLYGIVEFPTAKVSVETQVRVGSEWRTEARSDEYRNRTAGSLAGLAFTTNPGPPGIANPDAHGRYLSSATYQCDPVANTCPSTPDRVTYVKYEMDQKYRSDLCLAGNTPCEVERNRRVVSSRTLYVSDGGRFVDTNSSRFDGLGHYRQTDSHLDITSDEEGRSSRSTSTEYNATNGIYAVDGNGNRQSGYTTPSPIASDGSVVPWLLETYKESSTTEGVVTAKRLYCFDSITGLLARQRVLAGATNGGTDLVTVLTRSSGDGNVTREEYFGGDKQVPYAVDAGGESLDHSDLCEVTLPGHNQYSYRINHAYSRGVRNRTWYSTDGGASAGFNLRNDTIDASTGLVQISRDSAGVETDYDYDQSGRLTDVKPAGLAATHYAFENATDTTPASVTVTTGIDPTDGTTEAIDTVSTFLFDSLGRVQDEKRLMPDGTWSIRRTGYDDAGRRSAVSELEPAPAEGEFTPSHQTEFSGYDAYGRVKSVKAPDGKIATTTYVGARLTTRTYSVATSETGETNVSTAEEVDAAGRLIRVTEDGNAVTTYGYDVGGRLSSVSIYDGATPQNRWFTYDLRGLLTSEQHPESGTTSYEYDARGHVVKRVGAVSTIVTEYDDAERVKVVKLENGSLLKRFFYDRANTVTDKSNGKLDYAERYNRADGLPDITITEKYIYTGPGGMLARRETSLNSGEKFAEDYTYDLMGNIETLHYPACLAVCPSASTPARSVTSAFSHGSTTQVGSYTSSATPITYHANGLLHTVDHTNVDGTAGPRFTQTISASDGMARPSSISVTNFCTNLQIEPLQAKTVNQGSSANLTVSAPGATMYQWFEGSGSSATALDGQNESTLSVQVFQNTLYWVRVGNGTCTLDSEPVLVAVNECPGISASITGPGSMVSSTQGDASVPSIPDASYLWTVTNGTIVSGQNSPSIQFTAGCAGTVNVAVTITTSCDQETRSLPVTIQRFTATASGPSGSTPQGGSAEIRAALTGVGPWDLVWDDGVPQDDVAASPARRTLDNLQGTRTYKVQSVLDAAGCAGTPLGSALVTVKPPAPDDLAATAAAATRVNLSWSFSGSKDRFEIYRGGTKIGSTTATSYTDTTATAATAYLYQIRAVKNETSSDPSPPDLATTVIFADDPVVAGVTLPSAQHLIQLRQAVNAVRRAGGLANASFSDATIDTGTIMKAVHVQELGTALNQGRVALGLGQLSFRTLLIGKSILAADINDLRGGVK
jgi:YD repeat-containing protein